MSRTYISSKISKKEITAKCPVCGKLHTVKNLNWTGKGMPIIVHPECKRIYAYKQNNPDELF